MLAAAAGILLSIATLLIPSLLESEALSGAERDDFYMDAAPLSLAPDDSPAELNFTIHTPPLSEGDLLYLYVYAEGKQLAEIDCLGDAEADYSGATEITCTAMLSYDYSDLGAYDIIASFTRDETEYSAGPAKVTLAWSSYEDTFWGFSVFLLLLIAGAYLAILLPVTAMVAWSAFNMKHGEEYSIGSLIIPAGKTLLQKFHSFLVSPYFWAFESIGIIIIVVYMALAAQFWKSGTALAAFILSGLISFIVPYLWCVAWWYADYREREPLRIMVTFFLWGMLSALMAIGLNTVAGVLLAAVGFGFLASFFLAPPTEEFYKGAGAALLAEHREYNSIEDGIVFGFTIGMGFSFIENWLYLLNNPMGSNIGMWLLVFFLRSIMFSANHGFFTAITGAVIGWLIERRSAVPALGMLVGVPVAAFFHAMHNSGEAIAALLGGAGTALYCCLFIPIFDYGGFLALLALFIRSVLRKKGDGRP